MKYLSILVIIITTISCGQSKSSEEVNQTDLFESIIYENISSPSEIDDSLKQITLHIPDDILYDTIFIDNELFYVVEGDLFLDEDEFNEYIESRYSFKESNKIVGIRLDGEIIKTPHPNNIRYSIIQHSFASLDEYNDFVNYMNEATSDWENICNVNFVHVLDYDFDLKSNDNPEDLTFVIKKLYSNSDVIAKAFYPFYPKNRRKVLINHSFFTTSVSQVGILRHEIGHILGFRHEHIRPDAPNECNKETNENLGETDYLTKYDSMSVMHYYCGGQGSRKLEFTELDIIGIQKHYPLE